MVKQVGKVLLSPFAAAVDLLAPKGPKRVPTQRSVTRDDARDQSAIEEELRRRRGGAADMLTGSGGAEAGSGGKTTLG